MSLEEFLDDEALSEMLADFLDESESYLTHLNESLLEIDELIKQQGEDTTGIQVDNEVLNAMFRDAHSLKGLSAMLRLDDINCLTHKIENVFDAARSNSLAVTRTSVDVLLESVDMLAEMIDRLSQNDDTALEYEGIVKALSELLVKNPEDKQKPQETSPELAKVDPSGNGSKTEKSAEESIENALLVFKAVVDETGIPEKYLTIFVGEAEESLLELNELLENGSNVELASLLAICHRVKGSAATIGLNRAASLAHLMEDLIQDHLDKQQQPKVNVLDAFVFTIDRLLDFVHSLQKEQSETERFDEAFKKLQMARHAYLQEFPQEIRAAEDANASNEESIDEAQSRFINSLNVDHSFCRMVVGTVEFEPKLDLAGMKAKLILDRLLDSGRFLKCEPDESEIEDYLQLKFSSFALDTEEDLKSLESKLGASGVQNVKVIQYQGNSIVDEAGSTTKSVGPNENETKTQQEKRGKSSSKAAETAKSKTASTESNKPERPIETIRVDIDRLDHLMNQAGQLVINKARFSRIGDQFKNLGTRKQTLNSLGNATALLEKIDQCAKSIDGTRDSKTDTASIKSHVRDLHMELNAIRDEVSQLQSIRPLVNDLGDAVHQLDRVAEGIQKSVMDTRMVPIGPLFSRFKRVVRDYTKGTGKEIRLVIRGDKTELDKRMIDALGDPLIHMVRNSADHGIEPPEERQAIGKLAQGTITLDAFHRGNQVFVEVHDDGRGLDPNRLKQKAVSKGIISAEEADRMSSAQAFQLIWEPGFSTAEKVTEISGRGMGMDIVHSKLEKLNGTVVLDSELTKGTTITIKLPLTMAILPSLLTVIENEVFAIPVESVLEIVQVKADQFSTVHGATTARIRGRVVSVVQLHDVLDFGKDFGKASINRNEQTLVIVGNKGNEIGLFVDDLLGEEDIVIKSLAENYRNVVGFAGASILGDGKVSLILDVSAIMELSCC